MTTTEFLVQFYLLFAPVTNLDKRICKEKNI